MAARARRALVLCAGPNCPAARAGVAGPHAVLWRRGSGHGIGGRVRHQLPCEARRSAAGQTHCSAPGRGDRPCQAISICPRRSRADDARASARVTDVRVGGSTVLVAKGQLFLP